MTESIRILIVDDQRLMREGLRTLIELEAGLTVVGEAETGEQSIECYAALEPDVVLMDVRMPGGIDGVEATRRIRLQWPEARIIILTTFDEDEYIFEGLRVGAQGYLLKAVSGQELAHAIRTVAAGHALIDPAVTGKVVAAFTQLSQSAREPGAGLAEPLTERELDVLKRLALGESNREIAQRLYLAEGTVKNYVTGILQKIGARDRTQAALRGRELNLL